MSCKLGLLFHGQFDLDFKTLLAELPGCILEGLLRLLGAAACPLAIPGLAGAAALLHPLGRPVCGIGRFLGHQPLQPPAELLGLLAKPFLLAGQLLQFGPLFLGLRAGPAHDFIDLVAEPLLLLADRLQVLVGLAEFLDQAHQFLPAVVRQDVEHFLQVLQDSLLLGRHQAQGVVADVAARGGHVRGNCQPPGFRHGVGQGGCRQRLALAKRGGGLLHLLLQSRLPPGQFELMLRQDLQVGRFLRREFLQIAANRLPPMAVVLRASSSWSRSSWATSRWKRR